MLIGYKRGQGSIVIRIKILNSSVATGAGLTGLAFNSSGLIISTIADNESSATAYTVAGSTIETITTLGTFAAPTATKCRFKEVDSTNHKGIYEIQIADARYAVSSAKSLLVSLSGATNAAETDVVIPLRDLDPYDSVRGGMTALPNAAAGANGGLPLGDASGRVDIGKILGTASAGAVGYVGVDWGAVTNKTTTNALTGTTIASTQKVDIETIKTNPVVNAGTVTFPTGATLASTTNITGGTITTVTNLTNAPTAGDFTSTMKTSIGTAVAASAVASVTGNVGGNVTGSVGSVASGGIIRASFAADTGLVSIRSNTAQAGANGSITLDASASSVDDFYKNELILITGGTGIGQTRTIGGYTGSTKVATVSPNWATNPDNTSTFAILPAGAVAGASAPTATEIRQEMDNNSTQLAAIVADTNELQTDWTNGGRLDLLIDGVKAKTDSLTFTVSNQIDANVIDWKGATAPAMTGDAYARLGAPAGASVSADIAAIQADTNDIQTRIPAALSGGGMMKADVEEIAADSAGVAGLNRATKAITTGTVGSASTTTSIVTSAMSPSAAVTDQFKGLILRFAKDTTTTNLRGQATDITGSSSGGVLTVTALTTAPVSGDVFTIE